MRVRAVSPEFDDDVDELDAAVIRSPNAFLRATEICDAARNRLWRLTRDSLGWSTGT